MPRMKGRERNARAADLVTDDLDPACPGHRRPDGQHIPCGDLNAPDATVCATCGRPLYPSKTTGPARTPLDEQRAPGQQGDTLMPKDCSCGNRGICTVCQIASYDQDPFSRSVDLFLNQARRQPEPTPIRRHDRTGLNSPQTAYEQHSIQERLK